MVLLLIDGLSRISVYDNNVGNWNSNSSCVYFAWTLASHDEMIAHHRYNASAINHVMNPSCPEF
jgi:hypothetical protein